MTTRRRYQGPIAALVASFAAFVFAAALLDPGLRPARLGKTLSGEDAAGVLAAIVDFQRIYEDFFATGGDPALLDAFPASREVKHQVFRDVGYVRDAGLVFVQDLASATMVEMLRTGPDTAEALTYEEWNYIFQRDGDRTPASELKGMGQGFRYRLHHEGKRWIVTAWGPEDVPPPPSDDRRRKW